MGFVDKIKELLGMKKKECSSETAEAPKEEAPEEPKESEEKKEEASE